MRLSVHRDAIPDLILNNQHPDFFELFAQFLDVIGHNTAFDVYVGAVVKDVQGAGNIDFQCRRKVIGLLFVLPAQLVIQVLQDRHVFRARVVQIVAVDQSDTAVNDGLFHRL